MEGREEEIREGGKEGERNGRWMGGRKRLERQERKE